MDSDTTRMFRNIDSHLNSGLLNSVFAFWIMFFVFEPNMCYIIICGFKACWHGGHFKVKMPKFKKKYEKDSSSSNDSNRARKKNFKMANNNEMA